MSKVDCQMIEHTLFYGFENQRTSSLVCETWHVLREGPTRCGPLLGAEFKNHLKTSWRHAPFTLHSFFLWFPKLPRGIAIAVLCTYSEPACIDPRLDRSEPTATVTLLLLLKACGSTWILLCVVDPWHGKGAKKGSKVVEAFPSLRFNARRLRSQAEGLGSLVRK